MSWNSCSTSGESWGTFKRRPSDLRAAASRPFLMRKRGDSGRVRRPPERMSAHANWIASGMRYAPEFV